MKNNRIKKHRKQFWKIITMTVLLLLIVNFVNLSHANSGTARCYYNSSLSSGLTSSISSFLTNKGYSSVCSGDPNMATVQSALSGSHKVFFFHTHGSSSSPILSCSNGNLNASAISSSSNKFVYLSTCYSAYPANSTSSFRGKMQSLGVPQTVGFKNTISASTNSNGIHYFNQTVFYYMSTFNYQLATAVSTAQSEVYYLYGGYYGANGIEYTGGANVLP